MNSYANFKHYTSLLPISFKSSLVIRLLGGMEEIKVTLETLYDILRNEKKKEELQQLENTFFTDVVDYIKEKQTLSGEKKDDDELFAAGEKKQLEHELKSIKRMLKELYEKREKKIISIALNRSRTGSDIIDSSSMLAEEKMFYKQVLDVLDLYRRGVLRSLFRGEMPEIKNDVMKEGSNDQGKGVISEGKEKRLDNYDTPAEDESIRAQEGPVKIKFIKPMPSFIWKDMKEYGPYDKGEETEIFAEVAALLVRKRRAEIV